MSTCAEVCDVGQRQATVVNGAAHLSNIVKATDQHLAPHLGHVTYS